MFELLLLRRVRSFNKSRYSRNRQTARVIFYFGVYVNIAVIYAVQSFLYGFVFRLSQWWWIVYVFFLACFYAAYIRG